MCVINCDVKKSTLKLTFSENILLAPECRKIHSYKVLNIFWE